MAAWLGRIALSTGRGLLGCCDRQQVISLDTHLNAKTFLQVQAKVVMQPSLATGQNAQHICMWSGASKLFGQRARLVTSGGAEDQTIFFCSVPWVTCTVNFG